MSYSKEEQEKWEEFEQACLIAGIDKDSFCGVEEVFEGFEKYKKWRKEVKKNE